MRATHASVLREADPTVRRELARFDLADRRFDEMTVFSALLFRRSMPSDIESRGCFFARTRPTPLPEIPLIQE